MDSHDDVARDRNGKPILDRFGRPVRRRPLPPSSSGENGAGSGGGGRHAAPEGGRPAWSDRRPARGAARGNARDELRPSAWGDARSGARGAGRDEPRADARYPRRSEGPGQGGTDRPGSHAAGHAGSQREAQPPRYAHRHNQVPAGPDGYDSHYGRPAHPGQYPPHSPNGHSAPKPRPAPQRGRSPQGPSRRVGRGDAGWRRGKRGARKRPRIGRILAAVVVALLVVTLGTGLWIDTKLQRTDAIQGYDGRVGNTAGTNWLLVGSDSRAGLTPEDADRLMAGELDDSVGRTDTIMLVHLPRFGGQATMLSLPRDSFVDIPGYGTSKLNEAFTVGGPALLQQTVEQATGLRIDHYAEVGFGGFSNVVDAVGGIEICVDEPLDDPMAGINLQAGCQEMNGPTALGYVRSRYASANGDLDRVNRQKQFLSALSDKISSPGTLLNPFKTTKVINAITASIIVDNSDHVWNLAALAWGMRGAKQETVPTAGTEDTYAGNVLLWDDEAAQQLFESLR